VLAAAALLGLAGCGGGSDSQSTASTSQAASASVKDAAKAKPASQGHSASEEEQAKAAAKVKASADKDKASAKHGPTPAAPKGEQEPGITPQQRREATVANIALSSPGVASGAALPATYTCDGKDSWPALEWQGVPAGTAELALYLMNIQPVEEQIFFDWAVAGIDPALGGIETGKLPKGAVVGKNSFGQNGYTICPPQGKGETYMFVLYALPKALSPVQGFDPLALREEALGLSGNAGLMAVTYTRD
jgi:phosphatidylethanolamine-binding protein (PEBP) family uncharacterized protein